MLDLLLGTPLWIPLALAALYAVLVLIDWDRGEKLAETIPPQRLPNGILNPAYWNHEAHWREVQRRVDKLNPPR